MTSLPAPALPAKRESLNYTARFRADEFERLRQGLQPREMEDKWLIEYREPWLYFRRSWTGYCIHAVRFEATASGALVTDSWVNRDPDQYRGTSIDFDRAMLEFLIQHALLGHDWEQPVRS